MKSSCFDPRGDLIVVFAWLHGPLGTGKRLRLAVDTGASLTLIRPDILDELGYSPRQAERLTVTRSVVEHEHGYLIRVEKLDCLGHRERDVRVNALDLPDGWDLDGLIGLSFLQQFDYTIRSRAGRMLVERAA